MFECSLSVCLGPFLLNQLFLLILPQLVLFVRRLLCLCGSASATYGGITESISLEKLTPGAKTIKKNTNSTQNKSETHRAKQYEVTSFLSTDCELRHARKTFIVLAPEGKVEGHKIPWGTNVDDCMRANVWRVGRTAEDRETKRRRCNIQKWKYLPSLIAMTFWHRLVSVEDDATQEPTSQIMNKEYLVQTKL